MAPGSSDSQAPIIVWFRRDLRLSDHPALQAAVAQGRPVIPVFIRDVRVDGLGAAPKWRLELSLRAFSGTLDGLNSRLILRSGSPLDVLRRLVAETGASAVYWSRLYDPASRELDAAVKTGLTDDGVEARSFAGHLLFEPWSVETGTGGFYRVYSPFWRAVRGRAVRPAATAPTRLHLPAAWPDSERLDDWSLGQAMHGAEAVVARYTEAGEAAAHHRLAAFCDERLAGYSAGRDRFDADATSGLSAALSLGEIGPASCWHMVHRALEGGMSGAEAFLRQLVWREFAYHLMYHTPWITVRAWREEWSLFHWEEDENRKDVLAWKQGRTGLPAVDAAMREMQVTGTMHNRGRMIAASYLTKNLLADWRIGLRWFEEHLTDWDPANNALGWQWVAGCGPDASPYFRIFNPETQLKKFDPKGRFAARWIAEGQAAPPQAARDYFAVIPRAWGLSPTDRYPEPSVDLRASRERALEAYATFRTAREASEGA
jgi:deoxyribodipyrimidine photo-lyase